MLLTVKDRLIIPALIPRTGGLSEMQIASSIHQAVKFIPEEISKYELRDTGTGPTWNPLSDEGKEVSFTSVQFEMIKKGIDDLDQRREVLVDMVQTIEKFL
jgi:hypothetical protein